MTEATLLGACHDVRRPSVHCLPINVQHVLTRNVTTSDFDRAIGTYRITLVILTGSLGVTF